MISSFKKHWLLALAVFLLFSTLFLAWADWKNTHRVFTFAMPDVGQGDALFIESPTGTQILFDTGPNEKVIGELANVMPPFDRKLDAIIITNPDQDHIGGLSEILELYQVGAIFESGTWNDSRTYINLADKIKEEKIPNLLARKGMVFDLGGETKIEIIFPDQEVFYWPINDGSIVGRVVFGDTKILLTGDATLRTEKIILENNSKENLMSNILKIGHHGSNTSSSNKFLETVAPRYAFISVGKDNKYGHPKQEVLDDLISRNIKIFRTDQDGTVVLKSDGQNEKFYFK